MSGFVRSIKMSHCGNDETGQNALCGKYLNNKRTGKDATKPRTPGLLGHSVLDTYMTILYVYLFKLDSYFSAKIVDNNRVVSKNLKTFLPFS